MVTLYSMYLAAPLFSLAERNFNRQLAQALWAEGFLVLLPQERTNNFRRLDGSVDLSGLALDCADLANSLDIMVAIVDGSDVDSGTALEVGMRHSHRKPILAVRTDFRGSEDPLTRVNAMFRLVDKLLIYDGDDIAGLAKRIAKESMKILCGGMH